MLLHVRAGQRPDGGAGARVSGSAAGDGCHAGGLECGSGITRRHDFATGSGDGLGVREGLGGMFAPAILAALNSTTRIFVAVAAVDLRRSFDGLSAYVEAVLMQYVVEGGLFCFH